MRRSAAFLFGVLTLALFAGPRSASAGAFPQSAGHGVVIVTSRFSGSSRVFDPQGKLIPVSNYQKFEIAAYAEYGLTDALTLFVPALAAAAQRHRAAFSAHTRSGGGEAGARWAILNSGPSALSVQASVLAPGSFRSPVQNLAGEAGFQLDGRLIYGRNLTLWGLPAFIDLEAGYRKRPHLRDEVRIDMTFGIRPWEPLLVLLQTFTRIAVGRGSLAAPRGGDQKIQASLVYDITKTWSVQIGGFAVIAALDARRERGWLGGVWYRF